MDLFWNSSTKGYAAHCTEEVANRRFGAGAREGVAHPTMNSNEYSRPPPKPLTSANVVLKRGLSMPDIPTRSAGLMTKRGMTAADSLASYRAARRACQHVLDMITVRLHEHRKQHNRPEAMFVDTEFSLCDKDSLYPQGAHVDVPVGAPADIVRLQTQYNGVPVLKQVGVLSASVVSPAHARSPMSPTPLNATPGTGKARKSVAMDLANIDERDAEVDDDDDVSDGVPRDPMRRYFDEVRLGSVGDSHFLTAVNAVLSNAHPQMGRSVVNRLFVLPRSYEAAKVAVDLGADEPSMMVDVDDESDLRYGVIGVLFFVNGAWEWVLVDDTIAVDPTGRRLSFLHIVARITGHSVLSAEASRSQKASGRFRPQHGSEAVSRPPSELWQPLLEKAFAKLHFAFDGINGGHVREALVALTGGIEVHKSLSKLTQTDDDVDDGDVGSVVAQAIERRKAQKERTAKRAEIQNAGYTKFQDLVLDGEGTSVVLCAKAVANRLDASEDDSEENAVAELIVPGGWYPIVQTWRGEHDAAPYVEVYDGWSTADDIYHFNSARAMRRRERSVQKYLDEALRGQRTEASVHRLANSALCVKRGSAARFVTMKWTTFTTLFDDLDGVQLFHEDPSQQPDVATWHVLEATTIAPPTVPNPDLADRKPLQEPVVPYVFRFDAPVPGTVTFVLQQDDPKLRPELDHEQRISQPYAHLALDVVSFGPRDPSTLIGGLVQSSTCTGRQNALDALFRHRDGLSSTRTVPQYRREVHVALTVTHGYYLICPRVLHAPATPFSLRVVGRSTSVMSLRLLPLPPTTDSRFEVPTAAAGSADAILGALSAVDDDDVPLAYQRAAVTAKQGIKVPQPVSTQDGANAVSTRILPRDNTAGNQSPQQGGSPQRALNKVLLQALAKDQEEAERQANAYDDDDDDPSVAAARHARAAVLLPDAEDPFEAVRAGVGDAFAAGDIAGRGMLTDERQLDRALMHLLLHHTDLGRRMRSATLELLPSSTPQKRASARRKRGLTCDDLLERALGAIPLPHNPADEDDDDDSDGAM